MRIMKPGAIDAYAISVVLVLLLCICMCICAPLWTGYIWTLNAKTYEEESDVESNEPMPEESEVVENM